MVVDEKVAELKALINFNMEQSSLKTSCSKDKKEMMNHVTKHKREIESVWEKVKSIDRYVQEHSEKIKTKAEQINLEELDVYTK